MVEVEQKLFSIFPERKLLKRDQRKGFKSSKEKYIDFNVYSLEHHRALETQ